MIKDVKEKMKLKVLRNFSQKGLVADGRIYEISEVERPVKYSGPFFRLKQDKNILFNCFDFSYFEEVKDENVPASE